MKIGLRHKHESPQRRMWLAMSSQQRLLAVALGLYRIDAEGQPVLDGEVMARRLEEITKATEGRL